MKFGVASRGYNVTALPRLAAFGDSITQRADSTQTTFTDRNNVGYLSWVRVLTRGRFDCPIENNFGVNGSTTLSMLTRLTSVLAVKPSVCIVHAGTNDIVTANAGTYAVVTANLTTIYDALAAIGCVVIAVPILGRSGANALSSDNHRRVGLQINEWIRRQAHARTNFYVADCGLVFDDPTSTAWAERSGMTVDNLHSNNVGAYTIARKIVDVLNIIYPDYLLPFSNPLDTYDATYNPTGNLLTNGDMAGSTAAGVATGNIPTSWTDTFTTLLGATAAYSKVVLADGRNATQLDLSGNYNGSAGAVLLNGAVPFANIASGDRLQAAVDVSIGANTRIVGLQLSLQVTVSGVTTYVRDGTYDTSYVLPAAGFSGMLQTPILTVPGTPTSAALILRTAFLNVGVSSAISATVQWASASVRKL